MKLRAQITIDILADSFADAAMHQDRIEAIIASIKDGYPQAALEFRERRERPPRRELASGGLKPIHYTGRMHEYDQ